MILGHKTFSSSADLKQYDLMESENAKEDDFDCHDSCQVSDLRHGSLYLSLLRLPKTLWCSAILLPVPARNSAPPSVFFVNSWTSVRYLLGSEESSWRVFSLILARVVSVSLWKACSYTPGGSRVRKGGRQK